MALRTQWKNLWVGNWREGQIACLAGHRNVEGNLLLLGDQESVGCDTKRCVMVKASPAATFIVTEPNFLLQFEIVASIRQRNLV